MWCCHGYGIILNTCIWIYYFEVFVYGMFSRLFTQVVKYFVQEIITIIATQSNDTTNIPIQQKSILKDRYIGELDHRTITHQPNH